MKNTKINPPDSLSEDVLRAMPEALIVSDLSGTIRLWNTGAESIFGFPAGQAIGQSLDLIIPEPLLNAHWEGFKKAVICGNTVPGRSSRITRSLHKSGSTIYVDMSFAMVSDRTGKLVGAMAVARDATARYLEEKNLRRTLTELAHK